MHIVSIITFNYITTFIIAQKKCIAPFEVDTL